MGVEGNYLEKSVGLRKVREDDLKGWGRWNMIKTLYARMKIGQ